MRTLSVAATIASIAFGTLEVQAIGSPAVPQTNPSPVFNLPTPLAEKEFGVQEETPNQRRRRLGQEITASYPPLEYGEALETPNQRRIRLGQPIQASYEPPLPGVAEETPNHRRQRLGEIQP
jgi:hypothetical protein